MRIDLDSIAGSKRAFAHVYEPGELDFSDERVRLTGPQSVSGTLTLKGKRVFLQGHLTAHTQVDCDRCLRLVGLPVESEFNLQYVTRLDYESFEAEELEDEDLAVSVFDGEAIDIDDLVREQVFLTVPERNLCREDCKGLCLTCGTDLNLKDCSCEAVEVDPRWAVLKNLRS